MGQAYTLLLVEDEENILYGMQSVLSCYLEEISEVYIARNGKEALDIIRKEKISIIISDLRMPEMNGVEMIKKIREKEYDIPIIVLTALADFKLAQELIPLRIESYILKPKKKRSTGKSGKDFAKISGTVGRTRISRGKSFD